MDDKSAAAIEAVEDAIRKTTVGIVSGSGDHKWKGLGSGSLVLWNQKAIILTAFHVIQGTAAEDLRFFFATAKPPKKVDRDVILGISGLSSSKMHPFAAVKILGIHADTELDLAAVEILPESIPKGAPVCAELVNGGATPPNETAIVAQGFPVDIRRVTHLNAGVVFPRIEWTNITETQRSLAKLDPALHFAAVYPTPEADPASRPLGLSGAAFWYRRSKTPVVWHPNLDLAGVILSWFESSKLLKAARRETVEAFLTSKLGTGTTK